MGYRPGEGSKPQNLRQKQVPNALKSPRGYQPGEGSKPQKLRQKQMLNAPKTRSYQPKEGQKPLKPSTETNIQHAKIIKGQLTKKGPEAAPYT